MIQYQDKSVTVFESALYRTTSTVVITEDLVLLVDPTWLPSEIAEIRQFVLKNLADQPLYLLFTHSDYDHIIAYQAFPEAKVIASQAFQNNPDKAQALQGIFDFDDEYYITRNYKIAYPEVDILIVEDGQQIQIGQTQLVFYLAPGHNPDGLFTIVEPLGVWIAGDYLSNEEFPYIYHSSKEYEASLAKTDLILNKHAIKLLIPGHGDVTSEKREIEQRKKENLNYIMELRKCLREGREYDLKGLLKKYRFPKIMKKFHEENIKLMKKEIEGERE